MARTTISPVTTPGSYVVAGADLSWTAADVANGNQFLSTGNELLIVENTDAVSTHNVTVTSVADAFSRLGDIDLTNGGDIPASSLRMFGPFLQPGWKQTDGYIYVDGDDAQLRFLVIQISS